MLDTPIYGLFFMTKDINHKIFEHPLFNHNYFHVQSSFGGRICNPSRAFCIFQDLSKSQLLEVLKFDTQLGFLVDLSLSENGDTIKWQCWYIC